VCLNDMMVIQYAQNIHVALEEVFEQLARAARTILDPMMDILTMFLQQSMDTEEKNVEVM